MSRKGTPQWDFGELFPAEQTRRVFTVAELTGTIRRLLEKEVGDVWVTGEVTNLRVQGSGHAYFTLKDGSSQMSCVLFKNEPVSNREFLQDGQKLIIQGGVTVYEPRGQYQLIVRVLEPKGLGALQLAFEKLKRQLQAEGLFASERKRPLPRYPCRIGVVTSLTGAAIRDILHVIERRQPWLEVIVAPCRVQGDGAAQEIAGAIDLLNRWNDSLPPSRRLDLILVARGGGSLEDLWAFNEEPVARAIFASTLPVVSGVGHEIDFTISDFVADVRAATPSAAAEIITEGPFASRRYVFEVSRRLMQLVRSRFAFARDEFGEIRRRVRRLHPRRLFQEKEQYVDDLQSTLLRCARHGWRLHHNRWLNVRQRLHRLKPALVIYQRRQSLREQARRMSEQVRSRLNLAKSCLEQRSGRLRLLGPDNVLARGYSITIDVQSGKALRSANEARRGSKLKTRLYSGEIRSTVD